MMSRESMVKKLQEGYCKVTFTKKNGETRVMNCTLLPEVLKENVTLSQRENYVQTINPETVTVYDTDKKDWRCFRVDSVVDFES